MKIDFSKKFTNFNGEVLKDTQSQKELALSDICIESLLSVDPKSPVEGVEKLKRYNLAMEIYQGKKESLSAEEVVLLKELIGKYYTTLVVGQAFPMLDTD